MIDVRWLILIVPVSMAFGALALICMVCMIVGNRQRKKLTKPAELRKLRLWISF